VRKNVYLPKRKSLALERVRVGVNKLLEYAMNIYVGNLSYNTTEDDLRKAFEAFGEITSINVIKDKYSGESRGFGFVEMASNDEAREAMEGLNGSEMGGRNLKISEARPRDENRGGGGGGGFRRQRNGGYRDNW